MEIVIFPISTTTQSSMLINKASLVQDGRREKIQKLIKLNVKTNI